MRNKNTYKDSFFKNLNKLTGIPISKIKNYAKENNPFNILEHPMVVDPNEKQLEKIGMLNEFMASYNVLRMNEEESKIKFQSSTDSGEYFLAILGGKRDRERFMVAFLDTKNRIIETKVVSEGSIAMAVVYPREILKIALANDCKNIILSHNHPSGAIDASPEDKSITQRIVDIFHPLNIKVLDHIIVGGGKYSSMANDGYLKDSSINRANYEPFNFCEENNIEEEISNVDEDELEM
jgi:DNA repair protein RadC